MHTFTGHAVISMLDTLNIYNGQRQAKETMDNRFHVVVAVVSYPSHPFNVVTVVTTYRWQSRGGLLNR